MYTIQLRSNSHSPAGHEIKLNKKINVLATEIPKDAVLAFFKGNKNAQRFLGCPVAVISRDSYDMYIVDQNADGYTISEVI